MVTSHGETPAVLWQVQWETNPIERRWQDIRRQHGDNQFLPVFAGPSRRQLPVTTGRGRTALRGSVPSIVRSALAERPFADPPEATIHPGT